MEKSLEKYKSAEKLDLKDIQEESPKIFTNVHCPSCSEEVPADHLNLQNSMAKCGSCHVIFSIDQEVKKVSTASEMKQEVFRPEGIDLFYFGDDLDITVQQHVQGVDLWGLSIFPAAAFFSTILYFSDKTDFSLYIPLAITAVALYFIYRALNYSNNKTYIDVNDKILSIKSRPTHFQKDRTYLASDIDQLYIKNSPDGMGYFSIYMIINGLEGQKHERLITVKTLSKAKYLEQEIERYLHIEDREVLEADA